MVEELRTLERSRTWAFHAPGCSLIDTRALARCKRARLLWELFQPFVPREKPLKRFVHRRTVSTHRAQAAVLMKCSVCERCVVALLLGFFLFASSALAHRLDEYLQATLVTIEHGEVLFQINLTPGVEVADKVL